MKSTKAKGFSYRPKIDHAARLNELIVATEHDKAFFLDKALEATLPEMEKRYARELAEYRAKNKTYPPHKPQAHIAPDDASSPAPAGSRADSDGRQGEHALVEDGKAAERRRAAKLKPDLGGYAKRPRAARGAKKK